MDNTKYITVQKYAKIIDCSVRYVNKQIKDGKIVAHCSINEKNVKKYMIPVDSLPLEIREQLLATNKKKAPVKAKRLMEPLPEPKPLDTYSAGQRDQIVYWLKICREWEQVRDSAASKTQARDEFIREVQLRDAVTLGRLGVRQLTNGIFYRKYTAYRNNDYDGLLDRRGGHNKGQSSIPDDLWSLFLYYWLDDRRPTVTSCYNTLKMALNEFPEEFQKQNIPSEMAFRRRVKTDVDTALKTLGRDGDKAYMDRCMPYVDRLYDGLESNDYWIGDTHTMDFITTKTDGTEGGVRLYLCAWLDARSGVLTGWYITDTLSSDAVLMALRHGIQRFGIPKNVYVDNGREYLTYDVGGRGHRSRRNTEQFAPPPVFERMGITMVNAIVRNAKAKPIERTFNTFKNQISRLVSTFCGGNVLEKPESLKRHIRDGKLPIGSEMRVMIGELIDSEFNLGKYGGKVRRDNGKTRLSVWNENIRTKRVATEGDLALLLMRSSRPQKVSRNGVFLTVGKEKLWYYNREIAAFMGKQVYIRYDAAALEDVRVYLAETDEYIATVPMAKDLMLLFGAEDPDAIGTAMELQRNVKRTDVRRLKAIREKVPENLRIDMLDYRIRRAHERPFAEMIAGNVPVEIVRAGEEPYHKEQREGVVIDIHKMVKGL